MLEMLLRTNVFEVFVDLAPQDRIPQSAGQVKPFKSRVEQDKLQSYQLQGIGMRHLVIHLGEARLVSFFELVIVLFFLFFEVLSKLFGVLDILGNQLQLLDIFLI